MKLLDKIKDICNIEHHPSFTTRIVKTETNEFLVQIWDTNPLGLIHHWLNAPFRFDIYKELRSSNLEDARQMKTELDRKVHEYIHKNRISSVVDIAEETV